MRHSSLLIAVALLALTGCTSTPIVESSRPSIVASIYPLGFVAERVSAGLADVSIVVPAGAEPHEFEPTPGQIAAALEADIFLYNGGGVDPWAEDVVRERAADGKTSLEGMKGYGQLLPADPRAEPRLYDENLPLTFDPHVWLDPQRLPIIATQVQTALETIDPAHTTDYLGGYRSLSADAKALDADYSAGLKDCATRSIIVSHAAYGYLTWRYALTQLLIGGASPGEEGLFGSSATVEETAHAQNIKDIFVESAGSAEQYRALANDLGGTVRVLYSLESLTSAQSAAGGDYFSLMRQNLLELRTALRCR